MRQTVSHGNNKISKAVTNSMKLHRTNDKYKYVTSTHHFNGHFPGKPGTTGCCLLVSPEILIISIPSSQDRLKHRLDS